MQVCITKLPEFERAVFLQAEQINIVNKNYFFLSIHLQQVNAELFQ